MSLRPLKSLKHYAEFQSRTAEARKEAHGGVMNKPLPRLKKYAAGGYIANPTEAQARGGYAKPMAKGGCMGSSCPGCPECYSEGGAVDSWTKREDHEKGVHKEFSVSGSHGQSKAGDKARWHSAETASGLTGEASLMGAKKEHHKVLEEMKSMPKPHGEYAEGGKVDSDGDHDDDSMMDDMLGDELMNAFETKNKKEILDCIRALVLSCK